MTTRIISVLVVLLGHVVTENLLLYLDMYTITIDMIVQVIMKVQLHYLRILLLFFPSFFPVLLMALKGIGKVSDQRDLVMFNKMCVFK